MGGLVIEEKGVGIESFDLGPFVPKSLSFDSSRLNKYQSFSLALP